MDNPDLRHELLNLLGDWLTLADQAIARRQQPSGDLPHAVHTAYLSGFEDGMRQAIRDLSELLRNPK